MEPEAVAHDPSFEVGYCKHRYGVGAGMFPPQTNIHDRYCRVSCGACTPCLPTPPPPVAPPSPPPEPPMRPTPSPPSPPSPPSIPPPYAPPYPRRPCICIHDWCTTRVASSSWEQKCHRQSGGGGSWYRGSPFCCACPECSMLPPPSPPPSPPVPPLLPPAPALPPHWRYGGCNWPRTTDVTVGAHHSNPRFDGVTSLSEAMQRCVDAGSGCDAVVRTCNGCDRGWLPGGSNQVVWAYSGRRDLSVSNPCSYRTVPRRHPPNLARGGWANEFHCMSYTKLCLPPSPALPPPSPPSPLLPPGVVLPPPPTLSPPPPPSATLRAPFGLPGCADGMRCCVVIYNGGPGQHCSPVPVWDLASWHHPGGPFVQSSSMCGMVRHNWLLRSTRHPIMFNSQTALPQQGNALFGGGFSVGTYIDTACTGTGTERPPPPPPLPAGRAAPPSSSSSTAPFGLAVCSTRCCVVIYQGAAGRHCGEVPVWDLTMWNHPGGPFVQASTRCGTVRYGWLTRSPSHARHLANDDFANPESGQSLVGGGVRVGSFVDPACGSPWPPPSPPMPPPMHASPPHVTLVPTSCDIDIGGPSGMMGAYSYGSSSDQDSSVMANASDVETLTSDGYVRGASSRTQGAYECRVPIPAGEGMVELGYRLRGRRIFAEVRCPGCAGWMALGFPTQPGRMEGSVAVVGWLGSASGRRLTAGSPSVAKYRLDGYTPDAVTRMEEAEQTLEETSVSQADGVMTLSFTATLGEGGFPSHPLTFMHLIASYGDAGSSFGPSASHGTNRGAVDVDLLAGRVHGPPGTSVAPPPIGESGGRASPPPLLAPPPLQVPLNSTPSMPPIELSGQNMTAGGVAGVAAGIGSGLGVGALLVAALVLWLRHHRRIKATAATPPPKGRPSSLKKRSTYSRFDEDIVSSTGSANKRMTCVGVEMTEGHTAPSPPTMPPPPSVAEPAPES